LQDCAFEVELKKVGVSHEGDEGPEYRGEDLQLGGGGKRGYAGELEKEGEDCDFVEDDGCSQDSNDDNPIG
jgi:hypothetical protein